MLRRKEEEKILDVNASMQGNLVFSEPVNLRINGKFDGNLTTKGNLIIGSNAEVNATIIGDNVTIEGKVKGRLKALRGLIFNSTAEVSADIETPKVTIKEGAIFNGQCTMTPSRLSLEEVSEYLSIEEAKIMEWVNSGRIPVERNGDKLLFDLKEVESWISSSR